MTSSWVDRVERAAGAVRDRTPLAPKLGLVLGSGLGGFVDLLTERVTIPYAELPDMPEAAVHGHAGNLCLGRVGGSPVACLQGRVHLYEGHPIDRVVFGVRLLGALGCERVILTNAAGGIAPSLEPGDLMLITDHLNLTGNNPLVGNTVPPQFADMTRAYCPELASAARRAAKLVSVGLKEGVYAGLLGPSYETPAEIRMLSVLGASAVGMSTVSEVIALRHLGVHVGAVSCITNAAAGITGAILDHAEVERVARASRDRFTRFLRQWIELCAGEGPR